MTRIKRSRGADFDGSASLTGAAAVELYTLGGVQLRGVDDDDGEGLGLGPKHLALLVFLFHERRPMNPSEVIAMLGRGRGEDVELEGLDRAVRWLCKNLSGVRIAMTRDTIQALGGVWLDTEEVDDAIDGRDAETVARLYVGDFLEGFESDSEPFDEWAEKERARLRRAWGQAIVGAAKASEETMRWDEASVWWEILAGREPQREEAAASLIRSCALSGDREGAARAYARYRRSVQQAGSAPAGSVLKVVEKFSVEDVEPEPALDPPPETTSPPLEEQPIAIDEDDTIRADDSVAADEADDEWDQFVDLGTPVEAELDIGDVGSADEADDLGLVSAADSVMADDSSHGAGGTRGPTDLDEYELVDDVTENEDEDDDILLDTSEEDLETQTPVFLGSGSGTRRRLVDETIFTDSAFHHAIRTTWARLTTPSARSTYRLWLERLGEFANQLLAMIVAGLATLGRGLSEAGAAAIRSLRGRRGRQAEVGDRATSHGSGRAPSIRLPRPKAASEPPPKSVPERETGFDLGREMEPHEGLEVETTPTLEAEPTVDPGTEPAPELRDEDREPGYADTSSPAMGLPSEVPEPASAGSGSLAGALPWWKRRQGRDGRGLRARLSAARSFLVRYRLVSLALLLAVVLAFLGPTALDRLGELTGAVRARAPSVPRPSMPDVSLPRVSLPTVTVRTPSFVETSVSKIGDLFAGHLLEEGDRIIIADLERDEGADDEFGLTMALALEVALQQSEYARPVTRERALAGSGFERTPELALSAERAAELARAAGYQAVIDGRVTSDSTGYHVSLIVRDTAGQELYTLATADGEPELVPALDAAARRIRKRFGESADEVEGSPRLSAILSENPAALEAYARARAALYSGAYWSAVSAAREATRADSGFALAYRIEAEAEALRGRRTTARRRLEDAWRHRERLSERERLRLIADRHALAGQHSEAFLAYEELFQQYRSDVAALKSQAILQQILGARGGGEGNLRVAYTIDRVDWPPLARVARFLGYRGRLPDVDSIIASTQTAP